MSWHNLNLETKVGQIKFAEVTMAIGEKLLTNSFLLLCGSSIAEAFPIASGSDFWILYSLSAIGITTGLALIFAGADQYDKAHQQLTPLW